VAESAPLPAFRPNIGLRLGPPPAGGHA